MRFCLLDADYIVEQEKPIIRLFGVDDKGSSVMVLDRSSRPYLYVMPDKKAEGILKKNKMATGIERTKRRLGIKDIDVLKVFVDAPPNVPAVRDAIKKHTNCYEYNINFYKRYMIDKGFYPLDWIEIEGERKEVKGFDVAIEAKKLERKDGKTPKFKILAFDLEVVDNKIVMASFAGKNFKKLVTYKKAKDAHVVKNEKELIEEFVRTVNDYSPDIIVGYNSDEFDFEILRSRADEHKIELKLGRDDMAMKFARRVRSSSAKIMGRTHIDLFAYVNNLMAQQLQSEVFTLNEVAKELVGEGKEVLSLEDIINLWNKNDVSKLADYCLHDAMLTLKLSENILLQVFELSKVCGQLPFDTCRSTFGLLSEWFLIRKAHEKNIIAPNNPHWDEIQQRRMYTFKGGYVKEPLQGLHENIAVFDFRSLYPSIIATFNISPETLGKGKNVYKVPEYKHAFLKSPRGFVSQIVEELIERRQEVKKKLQQAHGEERQELNEHQFALKILANATYGMFGNPSARWYCRECAESAAAFGRYYIKEVIKMAEKFGFKVIYSDTDSLFVKLK